jgi:hypothetical protein
MLLPLDDLKVKREALGSIERLAVPGVAERRSKLDLFVARKNGFFQTGRKRPNQQRSRQ